LPAAIILVGRNPRCGGGLEIAAIDLDQLRQRAFVHALKQLETYRKLTMEDLTMRSDAQIKEDVLNTLKWSPDIKEEHIGVTVHNGAVTLSGHVPTYWQKRAANEATKRVAAVKAIVDDVEVHLESEMRMTDEGLAERIANVLKWNVATAGKNVKAEVKNAAVTLTGDVDWQHQRSNIERNIEHVRGVTNVINLITIKPRVSPTNVREEIKDALKRHAEIEASRITVEVVNGMVTLSGAVESLAELDRVEDAAWDAPGITRVVNNLRVAA
jgi:osmotically-inducible protein OsmY